MILRDEVTVIEFNGGIPLRNSQIILPGEEAYLETVPARVDYRSTSDDATDHQARPWSQQQSLVVVLEWQQFRGQSLSPALHNIEWRGTRYAIRGEPLLRIRGNCEHHYSVEIGRTAG